ncbi:hypothetical protein HPP92_009196 [Vanilla planifolia]|uniref:Uncharacterized protein n=1 Tax=Vanilla planifolia TaxID=51239 RepID=A0A835R7D1_VANPL|nr:hypothetical protein HPP92_009196 [Vanilla planifolia]
MSGGGGGEAGNITGLVVAGAAAGGEMGSDRTGEAVEVAFAGMGSGKLEEDGLPFRGLWSHPWWRRPKPATSAVKTSSATTKKKILVAFPT